MLRGNAIIGVLAIPILLAGGCSKQAGRTTPVARLDNRTLALEEIRARIDTSREPSQAQILQFVQRWISEESLYLEATEQGLDRTDEINRKMEDVRRQLAINALLEKEVYAQKPSDIGDDDVRQYYESHRKEFNNLHDVALVSYVLFRNRDTATEFRNRVVEGTPWSSAVVQQAGSILARVDSTYQTQASFLPAELWRVASNIAVHQASFPVNTADGYYIVIVWKFAREGQPSDLLQAEQEIRSRLIIDKRRKMFDQLVQKIRAKHSIEIFVNATPDTVRTRPPE